MYHVSGQPPSEITNSNGSSFFFNPLLKIHKSLLDPAGYGPDAHTI